MYAFITGSGFYNKDGFATKNISTRFGEVQVLEGEIAGQRVCILPRHQKDHVVMSSQMNHLANITALQKCGASCIISLSVAGVLDTNIPLARIIIPDDIFFPENRLPDGRMCSVFQNSGEKKGHLLASSLLHLGLRKDLQEMSGCTAESITYVHANGPRFNTVSEIRFFQSVGGSVVSQTCGPEAVLANELEIPYALAIFPVDYANGVQKIPTPVDVLNAHLEQSKPAFEHLIENMVEKNNQYEFENFVYYL